MTEKVELFMALFGVGRLHAEFLAAINAGELKGDVVAVPRGEEVECNVRTDMIVVDDRRATESASGPRAEASAD